MSSIPVFDCLFRIDVMSNATFLIDYVPMALMLAGAGILGFILASFWFHRA